MARYSNNSVPQRPLQVGDIVIFEMPDGQKLRHHVHDLGGKFCLNCPEERNDEVFRKLDLDPYQFCQKFYKPCNPDGVWPWAPSLKALTDCVFGLWAHIATMTGGTTKPRFKEGQRVIIKPGHPYKFFDASGQRSEGFYVGFTTSHRGGNLVVCASGEKLGFYDNELEPAEKVRPTKGDWVRVIDAAGGAFVGDIGQIILDDKSEVPFRVKFQDGRENWLRVERVELTDAPKPKPFKVNLTIAEAAPEGSTVFSLEQDGNEVNLYATCDGRKKMLLWAKPVEGGTKFAIELATTGESDARQVHAMSEAGRIKIIR